MEKQIVIKAEDAPDLFGVNHINMQRLNDYFPKLKVTVRGNDIFVEGEESQISTFELCLEKMQIFLSKFGVLTERDIANVVEDDHSDFFEKTPANSDLILFGKDGKPIRAKTPNQHKIVKSVVENDIIFAIGPAGTGKTYTAVALAVSALKEKKVKRIILTRPAVEAGENLGFLPGDMRDKLDPYLQPLYDALRDMIPMPKLLSYMEDKTIEIAPLAFMRGRTLDHAFVILDEAQNATDAQLKMFLTRMGNYAKFFITGDITQVDLPRHQRSGLANAANLLKNIQGIDFIYLNEKDVVRHKLVTKIISAYQKYEDKQA